MHMKNHIKFLTLKKLKCLSLIFDKPKPTIQKEIFFSFLIVQVGIIVSYPEEKYITIQYVTLSAKHCISLLLKFIIIHHTHLIKKMNKKKNKNFSQDFFPLLFCKFQKIRCFLPVSSVHNIYTYILLKKKPDLTFLFLCIHSFAHLRTRNSVIIITLSGSNNTMR